MKNRDAVVKPEQAGDKDPSEDVAAWLQEAGRRRAPNAAAAPSEELIAHLERLSGTRIRTREDVSAFVDKLGRTARQRHPGRVKNVALGVLLLVAVLQYYFIDVQLQILSQSSLTVFVPARHVEAPALQRI